MPPNSTSPKTNAPELRLGLPKGRMKNGVADLLAAAGIGLTGGERNYRPTVGLEGATAKLLKPQNIVEMLQTGSRDLGFAGADWVAELKADLPCLLDTGLDPVRVVAAAPAALIERLSENLPTAPGDRPHIVATEYRNLTMAWLTDQKLNARVLKTFGATEVFPPEDADFIVDNTATGSTLRDNGLVIFHELMRSTTRLYASRAALADPDKKKRIDEVVVLLKSVLDARSRVMLEVNVSKENLDAIIKVLPCMRTPTVARLHNDEGYAVKAAVPRDALPELILNIRRCGGTDVVVVAPSQIIA